MVGLLCGSKQLTSECSRSGVIGEPPYSNPGLVLVRRGLVGNNLHTTC